MAKIVSEFCMGDDFNKLQRIDYVFLAKPILNSGALKEVVGRGGLLYS